MREAQLRYFVGNSNTVDSDHKTQLGVAVIGPTSYNTMKEPQKYTFALITSVIIAVLVYMSLGVLGAMSYSMDPRGRWRER